MAAAYDHYNYTRYWIGRKYEHESEVIAINALLKKVNHLDTIMEIGAGYGRLTPLYLKRAKNIIISDPSSKLLKVARSSIHKKNVNFIHSKLENLPGRVKKKSVDLIIMVRVIHHLDCPVKAIKTLRPILKRGGYLLLEFPNKRHLKAMLLQLIKGNITFALDISPLDVRTSKTNKKRTLPFYNYHPDIMETILVDCGFSIIEKISVSNVRNTILKRLLPLNILIMLEKFVQKLLSRMALGPSIFILAKKN